MVDFIIYHERVRLELERECLYQQLDEKDEEINQQSLYVKNLKDQILEQKELIESAHREYEVLQSEMGLISYKTSPPRRRWIKCYQL